MTERPVKKPRMVRCPQCGGESLWSEENKYRPFCSERCKLIDLGAWANETHAIPGDLMDDELFSEELSPRSH